MQRWTGKTRAFLIRFGVASASVLVEILTTMQIIIRLIELKIVLYP